jgi:hypothetical protein
VADWSALADHTGEQNGDDHDDRQDEIGRRHPVFRKGLMQKFIVTFHGNVPLWTELGIMADDADQAVAAMAAFAKTEAGQMRLRSLMLQAYLEYQDTGEIVAVRDAELPDQDILTIEDSG